MTEVPIATPVTTPVPEILALAGTELIQAPPADALLRAVVPPVHTFSIPVMAPGVGFTVTTTVAVQPVGSVYDIVAVPPATPVTLPEASTVAMAGVPLSQVPPVDEDDNSIELPWQKGVLPVMAAGCAFTVTTDVVIQPPEGTV